MQREYTRSPFGKTDALYLILTALATVGAGSLMGLLGGAHNGYAGLVRPAFTPPDAVFPIVWSAMYAMAGASLYLTIAAPESDYRTASLWLNGAGLALNFGWIPVFFLLKAYFAAFLIIAALDRPTPESAKPTVAVPKSSPFVMPRLIVPYSLSQPSPRPSAMFSPIPANTRDGE